MIKLDIMQVVGQLFQLPDLRIQFARRQWNLKARDWSTAWQPRCLSLQGPLSFTE